MNTTSAAPHRSYCHPIDSTIIRALANPAVNTVFRKVLSIAADSSFGQMIATAIPVNEHSFPYLHKMVKHCADTLRIPMPYVVVSNALDFNAFTTGSDKEPYIVLGSMLVKALNEEQLHFVIGHECGHIAMGHVIYQSVVNVLAMLAKTVPILGEIVNSTAGIALNAWSRRSEITADRAGLLCCGDLEVAQRALLQLEMGLINTEDANIADYLQSSKQYRNGSIIRRLGEYSEAHPILSKRMEALELFMGSSLLHRIAGQKPPQNATNDRELERRIEKLVRVL